MSVKTKPRDINFVNAQLKKSERFGILLDRITSNMEHFGETLKVHVGTAHDFLAIYNGFGMTQFKITPEQAELGLTNNLMLGIYCMTKLVAIDFNCPVAEEERILHCIVDFQIDLIKDSGLRFIDDDKLTTMAAFWYSYATSPRATTPWEDLANSLYDILWLFLEPIETSVTVEFNRATFTEHLKANIEMKKNSKATTVEAKKETVKAEPKPVMLSYNNVLDHRLNSYAAQMVQHGIFANMDDLLTYKSKSIQAFASAEHKHDFSNFKCDVFLDEKKRFNSRFFQTFEAQVLFYDGLALLPLYEGLHNRYFNAEFTHHLIEVVEAKFEAAGFCYNGQIEPMFANTANFVGVFNTYVAVEGPMAHVKRAPTNRGQFHTNIGSELLIIASHLVDSLICYFNGADKKITPEVRTKIIIEVLSYLVRQADEIVIEHEIKNGSILTAQDPLPADSIFNTGAEAFYNNLLSIVTKEISIMTTKTASASAVEALVQANNQAQEAEMKKEIAVDAAKLALEQDAHAHWQALEKRIRDLEIVAARTADLDKGEKTTESKEALERIKVASQEAVKAVQAEGGKKKGLTSHLDDLTTTEIVVGAVGSLAIAAAVGYGIYKAVEYFMDDSDI